AVLLLLMSHRDGWQTSEKDVSEMFGWGRNRRRATRAFKWLMVDRRMVVREHRRDGAKGYTNREYIFHADGHRMTVEEIEKWSAPCTKTVQAPCTRKVQA